MADNFGQHVKRQERIEEYSKWSGAQPVVNGMPVKTAAEASAAPDERLAQEQVQIIRGAFKSGVKKVICDCQHEPTVSRIRQLLLPEELADVSFGGEGVPLQAP